MQFRWEFDQVKKKGLTITGNFIVFSILAHQPIFRRRIGYIITKRIGSAPVRNKIRRRLREIYRAHRGSFKTGISIVIIARPKASKASYLEFKNEFLNLYRIAHKSLCELT